MIRRHPAVPISASLGPAKGLLQRRCACGNPVGAGGECESCRRKRLQRSAPTLSRWLEPSSVRREVSAPSAQSSTPLTRPAVARFDHDFSRIRLHADSATAAGGPQTESANSVLEADEDPIHRPLIEEFRREQGLPPGGRDDTGTAVGPGDAEIKYGGYLMPCPTSTEVATVIDMRNDGLAAGFRTAYGIHSQMRVRPDGPTWDGKHIPESLTLGPNTCPESLTRGDPCSGSSTFIVGDPSGRSTVLPGGPRPGARNRFWDFHVTHVRPRSVSVLHDQSRNPANLDHCSTTCHQEYSCGGSIIGRHVITRTFRKGRHNGQDVTFIDVTKR